MSEYKLANGYILTDKEIEDRAEEWEAGIWDGPLIVCQMPAAGKILLDKPNSETEAGNQDCK